jgi:hypothetical protein
MPAADPLRKPRRDQHGSPLPDGMAGWNGGLVRVGRQLKMALPTVVLLSRKPEVEVDPETDTGGAPASPPPRSRSVGGPPRKEGSRGAHRGTGRRGRFTAGP